MTQPAATPAKPVEWSPRLVIEDRCASSIVDRILREVEPFLKRAAKHIAAKYPAIRRDLIQEARITLWELDLGRFAQRDARYLRRILCTRMFHSYQSECRSGLTTGWSKHAGGHAAVSMALARRAKSLHDS